MADKWRQPEHPLERERLRLEDQGPPPTPLSGLFLGGLALGVLGLLLLIVDLLMLL